ncbi:hypothetical protein V8G54_035125 [Vigna mungo]|uniref:Uncharacterized protein n=1 Tax=Vigna mungo TaxID=3915 RepID=A0AAQ3MEG3_VIGMU
MLSECWEFHDGSWAEAASGGSFLDRSPEDTIDLIERKATDSQQFEIRAHLVALLKGFHEMETRSVKMINERIDKLDKKLDEIMSLIKTSNPQVSKYKEKEDTHIDDNGGPSEPSPETTTDKSRFVSYNSSSKNSSSSYSPPPPYPNWLKPRNKKMEELDQEILNTFKKMEINIPLLDVVVNLALNMSSLVKKHIEIPQKCKDPGPLKTTGVVLQLVNSSIINPVGVLKDILVRIDKLIFLANFYILDMKDEEGIKSSTIILGRPFMMTARTKINVHPGTLTMEIRDEKVHFHVLEAMKHPMEE